MITEQSNGDAFKTFDYDQMSSTFGAACELADRERNERIKRTNGNGKIDPWGEPDWSLLDDRRGQLPEFPVDALSPACREWVERAAHGAGVTATSRTVSWKLETEYRTSVPGGLQDLREQPHAFTSCRARGPSFFAVRPRSVVAAQ
jgi:hypothetical protein